MYYSKVKLSGSTSGSGILVSASATEVADTIHTTTLSGNDFEEIWLYAENNHTADAQLIIEFGGSGTANQIIKTIATKDGLVCIVPGLILNNGLTVKAYSATTDVLALTGFVHKIVA